MNGSCRVCDKVVNLSSELEVFPVLDLVQLSRIVSFFVHFVSVGLAMHPDSSDPLQLIERV